MTKKHVLIISSACSLMVLAGATIALNGTVAKAKVSSESTEITEYRAPRTIDDAISMTTAVAETTQKATKSATAPVTTTTVVSTAAEIIESGVITVPPAEESAATIASQVEAPTAIASEDNAVNIHDDAPVEENVNLGVIERSFYVQPGDYISYNDCYYSFRHYCYVTERIDTNDFSYGLSGDCAGESWFCNFDVVANGANLIANHSDAAIPFYALDATNILEPVEPEKTELKGSAVEVGNYVIDISEADTATEYNFDGCTFLSGTKNGHDWAINILDETRYNEAIYYGYDYLLGDAESGYVVGAGDMGDIPYVAPASEAYSHGPQA